MTTDGVYIAYQVAGEGPVDVAWQTDFVNNVDVMWGSPVFGPLFRGISSFARLILHDLADRQGPRRGLWSHVR
jgi:hypothetical protein